METLNRIRLDTETIIDWDKPKLAAVAQLLQHEALEGKIDRQREEASRLLGYVAFEMFQREWHD